ncbi:MAG: ribbon-helix-helix domain-containing protein [Acidimicrobiales bacterium]
MHKTSVYLSPDEIARVADLAEREETSQAEVIRRAIRLYGRHGTVTAISRSPAVLMVRAPRSPTYPRLICLRASAIDHRH